MSYEPKTLNELPVAEYTRKKFREEAIRQVKDKMEKIRTAKAKEPVTAGTRVFITYVRIQIEYIMWFNNLTEKAIE